MQVKRQTGHAPASQIYAFHALAAIVRPSMNAMLSRTWLGGENLPKDTGFIACANHLTEIDPLAVAHYLYNHGTLPHFMAKKSLFDIPVFKKILKVTGQVPVARGATTAADSLRVSGEVLAQGGAITVYPEGTLTRDPNLWPMRGRTGAARLALATGAPVVPIAHWGAQELLPRYARRLSLFPRKHVTVIAGKPVDLSDLRDKPQDREVLIEATNRIMDAITALVAELRGEEPPATRWNPDEHDNDEKGGDAKGETR